MNIGVLGVGKLGLVYALSFERHGMIVWASSYKQEYVEPTEFVDSELQAELELEYGDRIQFVRLAELETREHLLY